MKKRITESTTKYIIISVIAIAIIVISLVCHPKVKYYYLKDTNTYFVLYKKCVFISSDLSTLSNINLLRAQNTYISLMDIKELTLYFYGANPKVIGVKETQAYTSANKKWILRMPKEYTPSDVVSVQVSSNDISSECEIERIDKSTIKKLIYSYGPPYSIDEIVPEIEKLIGKNISYSPIDLNVTSNKEYYKVVDFTGDDYMECFGNHDKRCYGIHSSRDMRVEFPVLYVSDYFSNMVFMNSRNGYNRIHCEHIFVMEIPDCIDNYYVTSGYDGMSKDITDLEYFEPRHSKYLNLNIDNSGYEQKGEIIGR